MYSTRLPVWQRKVVADHDVIVGRLSCRDVHQGRAVIPAQLADGLVDVHIATVTATCAWRTTKF